MSKIHLELTLPASPAWVYASLVDPEKLAEFTDALAAREGTEGAAFSALGGHVTGRLVELMPNERIVQAWREQTWPPGLYSIAHFELSSEGGGTRVILDHYGFPPEIEEHLANYWLGNYWSRLAEQIRRVSEGRVWCEMTSLVDV